MFVGGGDNKLALQACLDVYIYIYKHNTSEAHGSGFITHPAGHVFDLTPPPTHPREADCQIRAMRPRRRGRATSRRFDVATATFAEARVDADLLQAPRGGIRAGVQGLLHALRVET